MGSERSVHHGGARQASAAGQRAPGVGVGGGLVFWMLVALGMAGLVPSVLLPEWANYVELREVEDASREVLADLRSDLQAEEAALEALQEDDGAIARLAKRDLRFRRVGERRVPLEGVSAHLPLIAIKPPATSVRDEDATVGMTETFADRVTEMIATRIPVGGAAAGVFVDPSARGVVAAMSVGLLALAFGLFVFRPS